ncbi:hypothetical protein [Endozoicomonas euniceicola]|uniref:WxL domain-containing protein n=1 Tax=Endozoicomonas euniceicola TaxID=1234143 RepID=A0ABY6GMH4_9GAMM|nr:hypothetical protein [Endozoicomonas euniceicola]UYM13923.1 hypothetical protein NX720_13450 [Endozoicomonas euniceicola]
MITKKTALTLLASSIFSVSVIADESQLGDVSYDATDISFNIDGVGPGGSILIANLNEIPLGTFSEIVDGNDIVGYEDFCVYRTGGGGSDNPINYKLTADNQHDANSGEDAFYLKTLAGETLEFTAKHYSVIGATGVTPTDFVYDEATAINVTSTGNGTLTGNETDGFGCTGNNASLEVIVNFADAAAAKAGAYRSQLTLTVEPI